MKDTPKNRVQTHKGPLLVHIRAMLRAKLEGWDAEREIENIVGCEISDELEVMSCIASGCDTPADVEKLSDSDLLEAIEGMLADPNTEIEGPSQTYVLCKHCDHFIDENIGAEPHQVQYVHCCDEVHHVPDDHHAAEPRDAGKTLEEWQRDRPDLFQTHEDGLVGPNSGSHVHRLENPPIWEELT